MAVYVNLPKRRTVLMAGEWRLRYMTDRENFANNFLKDVIKLSNILKNAVPVS
jgi:hypothetical protein